jgi:hypothetical protein
MEKWLDDIYCITSLSTCYNETSIAPPESPPPPPPYVDGPGCAPSSNASFFCNSTIGK